MFVGTLNGLDISVNKETTVDENDITHEEIVATVKMFPYSIRVKAKKEEAFSTWWENIEKAVLELGKKFV